MKKEIIRELIKLYDQYLSETIEERTVMLTNLKEGKDYGKQQPQLWKGDFDGFINWLKKLTPIPKRKINQ